MATTATYRCVVPADPATKRQPPGDLDRALSDAIERQRAIAGLSRAALSAAAGRDSSHGARMLGPDGPRQAWTFADAAAYAAALDVSLGALFAEAGVVAPTDPVAAVRADRSISPPRARMIVEMIDLARTVDASKDT